MSVICATLLTLFNQAAAKLSSEDIVSIVNRSGILGAKYKVQAQTYSSEVVVSAYRNPQATDQDCKINAVLIAKKIMDADPQGLATVRVLFYEASNPAIYRQVAVRAGDLKAFATGQISKSTLLSEIELTLRQAQASSPPQARQQAADSEDVLPGIYHAERAQLLFEIRELQRRGVPMAPYLDRFFQIEDKVRQGDEGGVIKGLGLLTSSVNELVAAYTKLRERQLKMDPRAGASNADGGASWRRLNPGDFTAADGIMFLRRQSVGQAIKALRDQGQPVDAYLSQFREMEELAARRQRQLLNFKLKQMESSLGLASSGQD